jgi:hypothetical protein
VIPEIKIELDQMLTEAFSEMNAQPHKNARLGPSDVYVLDQQLLKAYVQGIYSEYGIRDPLAPWAENTAGPTPGRGFATPQKTMKPRKEASTALKTQKWSNKTTDRIGKLKKKFQSELRSSSTCLLDNSLRGKAKPEGEA